MFIKNFDELAKIQASCTTALSGKFSGEGNKRAIVLCGGTGCLSSNSADIKAKIEAKLEEKGLTNRVSVNLVGCFGFCSQGPFVKIYPEDTLYRLVTLNDVDEIIEKDLRALDMSATLFCRDNHIRCYAFGLSDPENIHRVVMGERIGTEIHN